MTVHSRSARSLGTLGALGALRRSYAGTPRQRDAHRLHEAVQLEVAFRRLAQLR